MGIGGSIPISVSPCGQCIFLISSCQMYLVDLVTFNLGLSGCRNTPPFWLFSVITLSWPQVAPTYIAMLLRVSLKLSGQFPENVLPVSALHAPSKLGQYAKAGFFQRYRVCGLPGSVLTLALVSLILEFFSVGPIMFRSFVPYFRSYLLINLCYLYLAVSMVSLAGCIYYTPVQLPETIINNINLFKDNYGNMEQNYGT